MKAKEIDQKVKEIIYILEHYEELDKLWNEIERDIKREIARKNKKNRCLMTCGHNFNNFA